MRLCDLGLEIDGTWLAARVEQLRRELRDRDLIFEPSCWLSDEWFAPDHTPGIAIPFFLAHPRLRRLEDTMMLEVEGGTKTSCMQLLRHEAGHAIETAFRLSRRPAWRRIFGDPTRAYPEYYSPKPRSRAYVHHLDWWYAQSHPTEDFAETFAVWLRPRSDWRRRYAGWGALRKLEYVDELMARLRGRQPAVAGGGPVDSLPQLTATLREHYADKQQRYGRNHPDVYDRDLRRLFGDPPDAGRHQPAATFLKRAGPEVRRLVANWTGEYPYTINIVLKEMIARCRELDLPATRPPSALKLELAVVLTMRTTNYVHSRDHRIAI